MSTSNGKVLIAFGGMHSILGVSPFAFGTQFSAFAMQYFFRISEGLLEFPLLNGQMHYENFAAFWFVYYGLLLLPLGILLHHIEKTTGTIPNSFIWTYLLVVLIGAVLIPFSGMTLLMLPHAIYMWVQKRRQQTQDKTSFPR